MASAASCGPADREKASVPTDEVTTTTERVTTTSGTPTTSTRGDDNGTQPSPGGSSATRRDPTPGQPDESGGDTGTAPGTAGAAAVLRDDSYRFRFTASGESGATINGQGGVFPYRRNEFWRVHLALSGSERILDWTAASGSAQTRRKHPTSITDDGIAGVALHRSLYGTAPNISPPPLVVPRVAVAGAVFEGKGVGSFVEEGIPFSVECTWRLTVTSETTVQVRGKTVHAWNVHREVIETVEQSNNKGSPDHDAPSTYTNVTDEIIPESLGFPLSVKGRSDASGNPNVTSHIAFTLALEE